MAWHQGQAYGQDLRERVLNAHGSIAEVAARIAAANDQTLAQLCQWVRAEHGVQVGVTTLWKTLRRLRLSLKKDAARGRTGTHGCSAGAGRLGGGANQA